MKFLRALATLSTLISATTTTTADAFVASSMSGNSMMAVMKHHYHASSSSSSSLSTTVSAVRRDVLSWLGQAALVTRPMSSSSDSSSNRSSSTRLSSSTSSSIQDFIKNEINNNNVVVFSKTYCPYCSATKSLFQDMDISAKIYELDTMNNGNDIQATLLDMTGQRTVPSVFIKGTHIGGNDKTQAAARSGKLQEMLGM